MRLFRIFRRFQPPQPSLEPAPLIPENPNTQAAQTEHERLARDKQELAKAARAQEEARAQEQAALDKRIDQVMSSNSEEFIRQAKQTGGE